MSWTVAGQVGMLLVWVVWGICTAVFVPEDKGVNR